MRSLFSSIPFPEAPRPDRAVVAVGDIHGRDDLLAALLAKLEGKLEGRDHTLVFLGDYVDRGADSRAVLDRLIALQEARPDTIFLRGNHEQAMLDFAGGVDGAESWLDWGGQETVRSYGIDIDPLGDPDAIGALRADFAAAIPDTHRRFLESLPLIHREGAHIFVHAGLDPDVPLDGQEAKAMLWIRNEFLEYDGDAFADTVIVHGHTPVRRPDNLSWRINVDTGAFWTDRLTAVFLDTDGTRRFIHT